MEKTRGGSSRGIHGKYIATNKKKKSNRRKPKRELEREKTERETDEIFKASTVSG